MSMQAIKEEIQEQVTGWVVRLRGLPFTANAEDVLEFFDGLEVLGGTAGVVFCWGSRWSTFRRSLCRVSIRGDPVVSSSA